MPETEGEFAGLPLAGPSTSAGPVWFNKDLCWRRNCNNKSENLSGLCNDCRELMMTEEDLVRESA